ncbi:AAA family ATPase [Methylomonas rhizoryzae]|uniref:AAA family ATPase n=1 Tax=Methylomonas rhizoryzae TaxID=2608981 RepID=UPI0012322DA8|nr:MoxR family ATPase [Methylomonas rhizoryzae]
MTANHFKFTGQGPVTQPDDGNWQRLLPRPLAPLDDPADYHLADQGLIEAVNTALLLGMPLLLTGEPGVGKTQLAHRIAYELGCQTIEFAVKSTSSAQDLFYSIDHLRRLHAAQAKKDMGKSRGGYSRTLHALQAKKDTDIDVRRFLHFDGLGLAILRAMPSSTLLALRLGKHAWPDRPEPLPRQPSVVLIDEIDKAPSDFCNDMLEEVRRLQFKVPELGDQVFSIYADSKRPDKDEAKFRPQIVITSNSEKGLPEPFLRRCVYYHMQPPNPDQLQSIVNKRLDNSTHPQAVTLSPEARHHSIAFFQFLKDAERVSLEKPPSTAELLNWLLILDHHGAGAAAKSQETKLWKTLAKSSLLKHKDDAARFDDLIAQWRSAT